MSLQTNGDDCSELNERKKDMVEIRKMRVNRKWKMREIKENLRKIKKETKREKRLYFNPTNPFFVAC